MKQQLNPPANWNDFEDLCHKLWRSIWGDPNTQKHGRRGQAQHGVDIYGKPSYASGYHGVQCKEKDRQLAKELKIEEIETESSKAQLFTPKLESFIIATTAARDTQIQEKCRKLSSENKFGFPISVWSWDDISDEIQYRPEIFEATYKNGVDVCNNIELHLSPLDSGDKLMAFMTRPCVKEFMSESTMLYLSCLILEFYDNAFIHGNASEVKIQLLEGHILSISDNGKSFDPFKELQNKGRGGHFTILEFKELCGDDCQVSYYYKNGLNVTILDFKNDFLKKEIRPLEIEFPCSSDCINTRREAKVSAIQDIQRIKKSGRKIKLLLKSYGPISGSMEYLNSLLTTVGNRIESASIPNGSEYQYEELLKSYNIPYTVR